MKRIQTRRAAPPIIVTRTKKKSQTKRQKTSRRLNVISPVHRSHSHMSRYGGWRRSARVRTL